MHRSQVQVRSSCGEPWAEMRGGSRRRFCEACQHHVLNLSALTEKEALEVVGRAGAEPLPRLCVRYESDHEGRILFRAEPGAASAGLRGRVAAGALAALTRAAPLIPISALLPACAAAPTSAPELPVSPPPSPCPLPSVTESLAADPTLGPTGALVVLVTSLARNAPLADAVVSVSSTALTGEEVAVTGTDGKVVFKNLPPASDYSLRIDADAYRSYTRTTRVSVGQIETLEVGLVEDDSRVVTMGVVIVQAPIDVSTSSQAVRFDQSFINRFPVR